MPPSPPDFAADGDDPSVSAAALPFVRGNNSGTYEAVVAWKVDGLGVVRYVIAYTDGWAGPFAENLPVRDSEVEGYRVVSYHQLMQAIGDDTQRSTYTEPSKSAMGGSKFDSCIAAVCM